MRGLAYFKAFIQGLAPFKTILNRNQSILNGLNTLFILLLASVFVGQKRAPEIVVFSKGLAIASFAKELNDKGVSDGAQRLLVNRFVSAMPKALAHYAIAHHVVVLNDKEGVAGAPNITSSVLAYIATEMTQKNQGTMRHG